MSKKPAKKSKPKQKVEEFVESVAKHYDEISDKQLLERLHDANEASDAEKIQREAELRPDHSDAEDYMRIQILVNVNGHNAKDTITVDRGNTFYSGLLTQKLAVEVEG